MSRINRSRRRFLKGAALGAAAVAIQPIFSMGRTYAANPGTPGRFVVVINMLGGSDGLNIVVPAHLGSYVTRRPNINLVTNIPAGESLHGLDANWKLHYGLNRLKQLWDANDMHIVQGVSYPTPNQSHFTSQDIYSYGVRDNANNGDGRGWLGRFADNYCSSPVEPLGVVCVGLGRRPDFESDVTSPLIMNNVATFKVDADTEATFDSSLREQTIREILDNEASPPREPGVTIFQTNQQAYELVERVQADTAGWVNPGTYPNTALGSYLRTISQLLHAQDSFGTRIFYTGYGGHDTHSGQHSGTGGTNRQATLMTQLDQAIAAFHDDMVARNLWNNCCIVVISEFGRRIFENGSIGTDHGAGNPFLVLGGRVKGQSTAGGFTGDFVDTDLATASVVPFRYDFRDVYANIVQSHLGLSPAPLFPDPAYTPSVGDINVI
ncbi:MAG: DUF1501 domain-containing protein [Planctomycetes bacterium]|nr:DUF1501 domain-containing protein [Planctomycetota bacterium]